MDGRRGEGTGDRIVDADVCRDAQTLFSGLVQRDVCSRRGHRHDGGALRPNVEGSLPDVRLPGRDGSAY